MGLYLNPNAEAFTEDKNTRIYVDKSLVIGELNKLVSTREDFVCMSRPRRFGKSMVGNMISAYYSKGCDTREIFSKMKVGQEPEYDKYLNKFNVIKLDLNGWYQKSVIGRCVDDLFEILSDCLTKEFKQEFPNIEFKDNSSLPTCVGNVYAQTGEKFVIIIDEYDVLVRERVPEKLFQDYLSFLNALFKDTTLRPAIALAYITGIIPIVRDKIQSKLNEFWEYTMLRPRQFAGYIGFTEMEVEDLCNQYNVDYEECVRWYDGYKLKKDVSIFNPLSVVTAMLDGEFDSYWSATGSFEALRDYILMDFEGIRQDIVDMISGNSVEVDVESYRNTMDCFESKDDVFTYLIHLGYLSYDNKAKTCKIPNEEVRRQWILSVKQSPDYKKLMSIVNASKKLLDATVNGDEEAVAQALDAAHTEVTSPLTYNDEHCFQSAICLAYFYANTRYTLVKELPTGKGYADLVLIPYLPNIPALVIELKRNKSAESAIDQIKAKNYCQALTQYQGDLLFVGINYDEKTKEHKCKIEKLS
ncbi:MAG: ATP-binding protein [Paludibacteraceae bacterium]|nr:ATP-binding protein [Paludibacteraceae bacterium]